MPSARRSALVLVGTLTLLTFLVSPAAAESDSFFLSLEGGFGWIQPGQDRNDAVETGFSSALRLGKAIHPRVDVCLLLQHTETTTGHGSTISDGFSTTSFSQSTRRTNTLGVVWMAHARRSESPGIGAFAEAGVAVHHLIGSRTSQNQSGGFVNTQLQTESRLSPAIIVGAGLEQKSGSWAVRLGATYALEVARGDEDRRAAFNGGNDEISARLAVTRWWE